MNDPTQGQAPSRSATLILTSSGPDDLDVRAEYVGAADDVLDGIDRTNIAHTLIDHFVHQLIFGAEQVKEYKEEAARPLILVPGGAHV